MDCCGTLGLLLAALLTLLFFVYRYLCNNLEYFEKRGIPGPKPVILFGTEWKMWKKPMGPKDVEHINKYGKIFGTYEGLRPVLFIAEPEIIKNILVKDFHKFPNRRSFSTLLGDIGKYFLSVIEGEGWKAIRSLVSPTFTTARLKKMGNLMAECGETLVRNFKKKEGTSIIFKDVFGGYTLDVIATCAFGIKLDSLGQENDPFVTSAKKLVGSNIAETPAAMLIFYPKLLNIMNKFSSSTIETIDFYGSFVRKIIADRGGKPSGRGDFLDLMLEETKQSSEDEEMSIKKKYATTEVIVAQAVLFFLAGFDTTANLLNWCSYHLAVNPEIQEKVYEEIKTKLEKHGKFNHDLVNDLPYLDMVINETFRVTPPAVRVERVASETVKYDDLTIEKDQLVAIPAYAIHHTEEFYPNPERFIPERFTNEAKANRNPYTFLPFGHGPRNCVGMRFALEEAKMALVHLIYNFKVITTPDTQIPPKLLAIFGLHAAKELKLGVVSRK